MKENASEIVAEASQYFAGFDLIVKLAFLIGTAILTLYFISIEFVPVSNVQSFVHLLYVTAILGMLILSFAIGALVIIPQVWLQLLKWEDTCALIVGRRHAHRVKNAYQSGKIELSGKDRIRIMLWYSLPLAFYQIALMSGFALHIQIGKIIFFIGGSSVLSSIGIFIFEDMYGQQSKLSKQKWISLFKVISYAITTSFFLLVINILFLFTDLSQIEKWRDLAIPVLLVLLSTNLCLFPIKKSWNLKYSILLSAIIVTFLAMISLNLTFKGISTLIKKINLGAIEQASITVDEVGCQILKQHQFPLMCEGNAPYLVENVTILWRAGEYYLRFYTPGHERVQLALGAEHIMGFSVKSNQKPKQLLNQLKENNVISAKA